MSSEGKSTIVLNMTFVRPAKFYLSGFSDLPHAKYYYAFLCFVYIISVLGNVFLLFVIILVRSLHTPKYMIVFNLALADLFGSTSLIPKVLDTFLFNRNYIVYEACLAYMFFVLYFTSMQSCTLVTMAIDRLVAICVPLRYHNIITKNSAIAMVMFSWIFIFIVLAFTVGMIDRLSFCGSVVVQSFYCDHGPLFSLACNDKSLNKTMAYLCFIVFLCIPLILIALTYVCIAIALSRIASKEERLRASKTCTSHLILVAIFYIPLIFINIGAVTSYLHPNVRIVNASVSHTLSSFLNPIIYALKTEEVWNAIKKLCKLNKQSKLEKSEHLI